LRIDGATTTQGRVVALSAFSLLCFFIDNEVVPLKGMASIAMGFAYASQRASMHCHMAGVAKPTDIKRLRIILVVSLGLFSATLLTGLTDQPSPSAGINAAAPGPLFV
jgi:hypothetical protein